MPGLLVRTLNCSEVSLTRQVKSAFPSHVKSHFWTNTGTREDTLATHSPRLSQLVKNSLH